MPRYGVKSQTDIYPFSFRINKDIPLRTIRNKTVDKRYLPEQWITYVAREKSEKLVLPGVQYSKDNDVVTQHYYEQLSRAIKYLPNPIVKTITEGITDDSRQVSVCIFTLNLNKRFCFYYLKTYSL